MFSLNRRKRFKFLFFIIFCLGFTSLLQNFHGFLAIFFNYNAICTNEEPIDVVYTWVNGSDPLFQHQLSEFLKGSKINVEQSRLLQRYDDKHELKFSLRSLEKFAPWINHVFIVTNGQIPYWLNLDYEKVTIVQHSEIFLDQNDLPTFSSPAIESHLHRIKGLSKKFLYFNDDIFLAQPIYLDDFYSKNHGHSLYLSYSLGKCAPKCLWVYVADDQCDEVCNNFECQFDGGDCREKDPITSSPTNSENIMKIAKDANYTLQVNAHNSKLMANEKIRRKRFKRRRAKKLRFIQSNNNNDSTVNTKSSDFNQTLCAYSASLQHTHRLFNSKYGFIPRSVPAHTPVLIDVEIMRNLQKKFFKEFVITSRNRLRTSSDLQYSFTYYYYIINEQFEKRLGEIFDEFDTDSSGTWSDREIRTLLARIYQLPLSYSTVEHFESILSNCSTKTETESVQLNEASEQYERYADSKLPSVISKELILKCAQLSEILSLNFGIKKTYKYRVIKSYGSQLMYFKQLISNITDVVGNLDEIRSEPRKFVCLNDNLDHTQTEENELIRAIVHDFYLSLFPFRSKFELNPEFRNRFLHIDELTQWKMYHFKIKLIICTMFLLIFYLIGFNVCARKLCAIINKILQ